MFLELFSKSRSFVYVYLVLLVIIPWHQNSGYHPAGTIEGRMRCGRGDEQTSIQSIRR